MNIQEVEIDNITTLANFIIENKGNQIVVESSDFKNIRCLFFFCVEITTKILSIKYGNEKGVVNIDKLSQELREIILKNQNGLFTPQDENYFCTSQFIKDYRATLGKKTLLVSVFNPFIRIASKKVVMLRKMFGSLIYKK